ACSACKSARGSECAPWAPAMPTAGFAPATTTVGDAVGGRRAWAWLWINQTYTPNPATNATSKAHRSQGNKGGCTRVAGTAVPAPNVRAHCERLLRAHRQASTKILMSELLHRCSNAAPSLCHAFDAA